MRKIISILCLVLFVSILHSQDRKKIIFSYEHGKDSIIEKNNGTIYKLDNKHTFKHTKDKGLKIKVMYDSIEEDIMPYEKFIKMNKGKEYPNFFSNYSFFIYIKDTELEGCLIEVKKIWLVEEKISN